MFGHRGEPFQDPAGRLDLGLGRLENRVRVESLPGRERGPVVFVVGVFGGDLQALALGQLVGELAVPGGQVAELLGDLLRVLFGGTGPPGGAAEASSGSAERSGGQG